MKNEIDFTADISTSREVIPNTTDGLETDNNQS